MVTLAHLSLLLRKFHVVKDPEDDAEEVVPPVLLKSVSVTLHNLKHYCQASKQTHVYKQTNNVNSLKRQ